MHAIPASPAIPAIHALTQNDHQQQDRQHDADLVAATAQRLSDPHAREALMALSDALIGSGAIVITGDPRVSPAHAARLLGVSRQYVDKLIASGQLAATRLPGSTHRKIAVRDLADLLALQKKRSAETSELINDLLESGLPL